MNDRLEEFLSEAMKEAKASALAHCAKVLVVLLLGLGSVGCHAPDPLPPPQCSSRMDVHADPEMAVDCAVWSRWEARSLSTAPGLDLRGWKVHLRPTDTWVDSWGHLIRGTLWCDYRIIELGTQPWLRPETPWSLPHELVHAKECPRENITHDAWDTEGHWAAVEDVRAEVEEFLAHEKVN